VFVVHLDVRPSASLLLASFHALHDNAAAASPMLFLTLVVEFATGCAGARALPVRAHLLVESADLAHVVVESLVNVPAGLGARLDELASELSGEILALCSTCQYSARLPSE
jgi:hypothetical protein